MSLPMILQQLQRNNLPGNLGQIKQMMGMIKAAADPKAAMAQMVQNNPQMKQVMELVQQSGGDPKKAFYALAQQKNVDPQQILDMLK